MKLFERHETDKTLDRLPEMPPGLEVPDDISGLEPPTTLRPADGGVRWLRWFVAVLLLGAAGLVTAMVVTITGDEQAPVDYMQMYGTDNPTFVEGSSDARTVVITPAQRPYMELYGTDNPVFVPQTEDVDPDTGEYMRLYGTDNPEFGPEPSYMDLYGTDNPEFVEP